MKNRINKIWAFLFVAALAIFTAPAAKADAVDTAITATQTLVTGYVTSIGGALVAVAVLWIGFRVGAKYVKKLGGL